MGRLTEFLAAVDNVTKEGIGMDTALSAAVSAASALEVEAGELRTENEALRAEIALLKATPCPVPGPAERSVNLWDLRAGLLLPPSFFTHPALTNAIETGRVFRVRTGSGRSEMGLKHPTLDMVSKEPLDTQRIYRLRFAVPTGPLLESKVNLFQFWAKAGENPVLACELTRDRLRFVQKVTGKIDRRTLLDIPLARETWYNVDVRGEWSAAAGALGIKVSSVLGTDVIPGVEGVTTYPSTPVEFRWGAYCPNYLANHDPDPVVGPEFAVLFSRVEVLEVTA